MNQFKGIVTSVSGLVLMILGLGIWRSPQIDWKGFLDTWGMLARDAVRLVKDPFAALGAVVMIIGLWLIINGIRRLAQKAG